MSRHLMAKFRKQAFDWKPEESIDGSERYRAALENGHVLAINHDPEYGWNWTMFAPAGHFENEGGSRPTPITKLVAGGGSRWKGLSGSYSGDHIPTKEHARQQAEEAYRKLYPIGSDTGGHDSGVDYSDLNRFMGDL